MANRGGQPGNKNGSKSTADKPWAAAILRQVKQNPEKLNAIALKLLEMAEEGEPAAIRELGDRLDGKAKQQIEATGEGGGPLTVQILRLSADDSASA